MDKQLTYFYDYNCPYCYISYVMIEKLSQEIAIDLQLVSWKMPENAVVDPKPPNYKQEGTKVATDLAQQLNVPIRFDSPVTGTRAAHEATKIAFVMGKGLEYGRKVFDSKWVEGKDISDREFLIEIAGQLGLDTEEFRTAFLNRQGKKAVEDDFRRSFDQKIWTIPSYQAQGREIQIHHFKDMPSIEELRNFILQGEFFLDEK
ncbi:DsbA family oxidoreductase [Effusibacillus consociatus]|uniref:DsbA family protein n=1 Tax=Effusibacillus consociatus TaxID=1117041 RepID=A0ABV9Q890_9BACL